MTKKISFKTKKNREEALDAWIQNRSTLNKTSGSRQEVIPMKRFTIDLPADLHRQFKSYCADNGFMMADVVRAMLEETLRDS